MKICKNRESKRILKLAFSNTLRKISHIKFQKFKILIVSTTKFYN